jgi:probable HAF family extracellular repeat protein
MSVYAVGVMLAGTAWAAYEITDLGTLGGTESLAQALNDNGEIVGYSYLAGDTSYRAFMYSGGVMVDLGTLGGNFSMATGINESGQVVGTSSISNGQFHAFIYQAGTMTNITSAYESATGLGINNNGRVVGHLRPNNIAGVHRGFIYNNGAMNILGTFGGVNAAAQSSSALGINDNNEAVGQADVSWVNNMYSGYHAFLYSGGVMTGIQASPANQIFNTATDVNDSGLVVGFHWGTTGSSSTPQLAFTYSNGVLTDIGTLPGASTSIARAVNNAGDVVGTSQGRGFLYSGGTMTDLNSLLPANSGWVIRDAYDINEYGQIVGQGVIDGEHHAYLMTPGC